MEGSKSKMKKNDKAPETAKKMPAWVNKKTIAIAGVALAVVLAAVIIIIAVALKPSNEKTAMKYVESLYEPNYTEIAKTSIWDYERMIAVNAIDSKMELGEYYRYISEDRAQTYSNYLKYRSDARREFYEMTYGAGYKYELQLKSVMELNGEQLDKVKTSLKALQKAFKAEEFFSADAITQGYEIVVEGKIEGANAKDDISQTVTVVEYKGDWLVVDDPVDLMF